MVARTVASWLQSNKRAAVGPCLRDVSKVSEGTSLVAELLTQVRLDLRLCQTPGSLRGRGCHLFGSVVLEVVLGLVFIYAWFSLACSATVEFLESFRAQRGKLMALAIERMLGTELKLQFYQHGLIQSLFKAKRLPSYLPSSSFATVTLDLLGVSSGQFRQQLDALPGEIGNTLRALAKDSTSYEQLVAQVEHWFDGSMDRCSGWFRRRARLAAFTTGLVLASLLNVDSLEIASALYSDTHLRLSVMGQAEADGQVPIGRRAADKGPSVMSIPVETGTLPLGWENSRFATRAQWADGTWSQPAFWLGPVLMKALGLLVTALAGSLGAAFWFDALRRVISIRTGLGSRGSVAASSAQSLPHRVGALAAGSLPSYAVVPVGPALPSALVADEKPNTLIGVVGAAEGVEVDPIVDVGDDKRR